jgi:peptidoglycan hydrolase-like protein with peptidoglycan-binding domain
MMFKFAVLALSPLLLFGASKAVSHTSKSAPAKASSHRATVAKTSAKSTAHSRKGKTRRVARRRPAKPSFQSHPTEDRYKEIQQALADKGYFKGQVDGRWDADSTESLKHFQADHQLTDDGKINSLSLIQLGLGPKRDGALAIPAPPQAAPNTAAPSSGLASPPAAPPANPQQNLDITQ